MAKADKKQHTAEHTGEPWRAIMSDVAKMMKEALKEADHIVTEHQKTKEEGTVAPSGKTVEMAVAIFEATVTAEGGRRMIEAQKNNPLGSRLVRVGNDGRPLVR